MGGWVGGWLVGGWVWTYLKCLGLWVSISSFSSSSVGMPVRVAVRGGGGGGGGGGGVVLVLVGRGGKEQGGLVIEEEGGACFVWSGWVGG